MAIFSTLQSILVTAVTFLLVITILVFVHELGHYWFAKLTGMKVDAFAVMMGGVRKTDLTRRLDRQLLSQRWLWLVGLVSVIITAAGLFMRSDLLFIVGIVLVTVVVPIWLISRLYALYHIPFSKGVNLIAMCWGGAAAILFVGTGFKNIDLGYASGFLVAASVIAVMIAYYAPVLKKSEDTPQGHGQLMIDGEEVPVLFRPVWSKTNREGTEFSLLLLPLGGFAAIRGMHPKPDASETKIEGGFFSKSPLKRLIVLFAGPAFSILLGILLITPVNLIKGTPVTTSTLQYVHENSPASRAGLQPGDTIIAINGNKVSDFDDIQKLVRFSYDKETFNPIPITVDATREGDPKTFTIVPVVSDQATDVLDESGLPTGEIKRHSFIGIGPTRVIFEPMSVSAALMSAVKAPYDMVAGIANALTNARRARSAVGGPDMMVEVTQATVQLGILEVLRFAGLLSISLGIMNLLPFPPLDGGQMVIAFIELLRGGKRLKLGIQNALTTAGMFLVIALMVTSFTVSASKRAEENRFQNDLPLFSDE